jgi:phosphoglycolate phosphatase-like HAD superfamily hydrolase
MTVPHSYSKKEREYLGRIEARVEILRARLATTNLPDPQEITKELHSLEWVLQQCSRGPESEAVKLLRRCHDAGDLVTPLDENLWGDVEAFFKCRRATPHQGEKT